MEAKNQEEPVQTADTTTNVDTEDTESAWVSPEVLAAQAGEQVEMGKVSIPVDYEEPKPDQEIPEETPVVEVETGAHVE